MNLKFLIIAMMPFLLSFLGSVVAAQTDSPVRYRIFRPDGSVATLDDITAAMRATEVVFVGEAHDDKVAHELELELLRRSFADAAKRRPVALSLEMFERDVQTIVDEYLADIITENHFLLSSRPWNNYKMDYRPLVEFARENKLVVIAANAPRRYVNRVTRLGRPSLENLSPTARLWLAPLPYAPASSAYATKFTRLMAGMTAAQSPTPQQPGASPHSSSLLDAQSLWDATMAHSIAEHLKRAPNALVLHVNGKFHSDDRLGIPEHLTRYRPATRFIVITIIPRTEATAFDAKSMSSLGDFVILTDAGN